MTRLAIASLLLLLFLPATIAAQEPTDPQTPPPDEVQPEEAPPEESETGESTADEPQEVDERELTPKQLEAKRKAAERAAKRKARREKRAAKKEAEEIKQAEKEARQEANRGEKAVEQIELGYAAIEAQKYNGAVGHFNKARELDRASRFEAELGLAHTEFALGNYAQAVQLAQVAVKVATEPGERAEALTFAGNATLAARPVIEGDPTRPQPGTQMFADTALRFYIRAIEQAPIEATEARTELDNRFPGADPSPRAKRLLDWYLTNIQGAQQQYGRLVATTYETLLAGQASGTQPLAVVRALVPPKRVAGRRPRYPASPESGGGARAIVGLVIEADGTVSRVQVLNSTDLALNQVVVEAMMLWTWEPALLPGGEAARVFWLHDVDVLPE
jgi:outer membrane biosynthesis protein TonB